MSNLILMSFGCGKAFRQVLGNMLGCERWPCGKIFVLDCFDPGAGHRAEARGVEKGNVCAEARCVFVREHGAVGGRRGVTVTEPEAVGSAMPADDDLVVVFDGGRVFSKCGRAIVVAELTDRN